ncbi:MAG: hypothetical protein Q8Q09_13170 [Deltaproteobacteria bacterium]|nr:hypothetical protein [Deltaproteobacteria bacterium]
MTMLKQWMVSVAASAMLAACGGQAPPAEPNMFSAEFLNRASMPPPVTAVPGSSSPPSMPSEPLPPPVEAVEPEPPMDVMVQDAAADAAPEAAVDAGRRARPAARPAAAPARRPAAR